MNHYSFLEIRERGNCITFAEEVLHCRVVDGRCAALWRGGKRESSVSIERDKWHDFATEEGGGLIELCAIAKFGGKTPDAIQQAQDFLGQWLNLAPQSLAPRPKDGDGQSSYDKLIAEGFHEVQRYYYTDEKGEPKYFSVRFEHPKKPKTFLQGTSKGWNLKGVTPLLYNLPAVIATDWLCIVEGEKDVETLKSIGIPATTNSGGAKKWRPEFSQILRNKRCFIICDNDAPGAEHGALIAQSLHGLASEIKLVSPSKLPKGDVTDYLTKEGGTWDALAKMISEAPLYDPSVMDPVEVAKLANKIPFANNIQDEEKKGLPIPRNANDMVKDLRVRLLGAPFRVGGTLFDQDRDTGRVEYIYDTNSLFSWIRRKTNNTISWSKDQNCVTKSEFFEDLRATAKIYSAVSFTPDYPQRSDVFYYHPPLPEPSTDHRCFWGFVDFFNPADDINRALLAAYIMAPIYYQESINRPLWIIDSEDGQGSGKSMIPELVARLYAENDLEGHPVDASMRDLEQNMTEIVKQLISPAGRSARIFRIDNATGIIRSSVLARLVTEGAISGRASYGREQEFRPNNLTYTITSNGATVDTDIASRSFYIMITKPAMDPTWNARVYSYLRENQMGIFADIIDIISTHRPFATKPVSRSPEFEINILQPACQTEEMYTRVVSAIYERKESTNIDEEIAARIMEEIRTRLVSVPPALGKEPINPATDANIFIRSTVLEEWFKGKTWLNGTSIHSKISELAKTGKLPQINAKTTIYPSNEGVIARRRGTMLNYKKRCEYCRIIGNVDDKIMEIVEG